MTIEAALARAADYLAERGVETPRVDAELLLGHVVGLSRTALQLERGHELSPEDEERVWKLVERRRSREPLAYILGEWGFRRLTLRVDPRVLIPRPETEVVVERCLSLLASVEEPEVLDVGTGSGAIALAIADEHPGARVTAFDNSAAALALAHENLAATRIDADRVTLVEHDLTEGFGSNRFDLVVSNPPYVEPEAVARLQPEVRDWEPRGALVGRGQTEAVARASLEAVRPRGWLVLECADGRAPAVAATLTGLGYAETRITNDLAGRERVVEGRRP
ncbi:MAG: peptide chain release factor N(5)-glutamine methyltransferase [Actinomycetota bacterium]|nr:peptide chain release factor N(5)-glutamine methyltransferase [Actinomycetota bacterium]